jgi:hypothetical protein
VYRCVDAPATVRPAVSIGTDAHANKSILYTVCIDVHARGNCVLFLMRFSIAMISYYYATYCSRRALDIRVTLSWMSSYLTKFLDLPTCGR